MILFTTLKVTLAWQGGRVRVVVGRASVEALITLSRCWGLLNVIIDGSNQDLFFERYFKCNANQMAGRVIFFIISSRTYTVSYWYFDQQNFEIFCNRCTMDTTKILNNQQNWKNSQKIRKRLYTKKKTSLPCPLSIDILRAIT